MIQIAILTDSANGGDAPEPEFEGKFLQLGWQGRDYLLFASFAIHRYHNQILGQFCEDNSIPHRWVTEESLAVDDSNLIVNGGGRFRVNQSRKTLELWDDSQVYGRFVERGLREKIAAAAHPWSGFAVTIR